MNQELLKAIAQQYPDRSSCEFSPKEILHVSRSLGFEDNVVYKYITSQPKISRGIYKLEALVIPFNKEASVTPFNKNETNTMSVPQVVSIVNNDIFVPQKDASFVAWGHCKDVSMIVQSKSFYPVYITGLSGNGKTMMVEQACAKTNREYIRVQITPETDEDDLIGGFRLINGETVFSKGPVIKAMEKGAVLLIDEIDRGSNKIMCLQGVLEGKPVLIKKTGEVISPSYGFNVIATANTKGKGSDDGRFIAATIIDEAFLERFTITLEQPYPGTTVEKKIVMNHMLKFGCVNPTFADNLTVWADTIRKTFEEGGVNELVSTRRLCHIVQSFSIFKDEKKAIELCVSRFDQDTKEAFLDLYSKIAVPVSEAIDNNSQVIDNILESI
jgi:cobaltochelatase CobS